MAYVQVPKDLTRVKSKFILNLTKRQTVCFTLAGMAGIPAYLLTREALGNTTAAALMILAALPFFFFAMYEKDGMPLEKVLMLMARAKFLTPGIRPYKTDNFYAAIQESIYEKEVLGIESDRKKEKRAWGPKQKRPTGAAGSRGKDKGKGRP